MAKIGLSTKIKKAGLLSLAVPFFLMACGDDSSNSKNPVSSRDVYPSVKSLPKCSDALQGESLLVGEDEDPYVCDDGDWVRSDDDPKDPEEKKPEEKKSDEKEVDDPKSDDPKSDNPKSDDPKPEDNKPAVTDTSSTDTTGTDPEVKYAVENGSVAGTVGVGIFAGATKVEVSETDEKFEVKENAFDGSVADGKFKVEKINLVEPYAMVKVSGAAFDVLQGKQSADQVSLSVMLKASSENDVDMNVLTHLASARTVAALQSAKAENADLDKISEKAVAEVLEAFGFDDKDYDAAAFAMLVLLQAGSDGKFAKTLEAATSDIAKDGAFDDAEVRIAAADWALGADLEDGFKSVGENAGFSKNSSLNFEKYLREFYEAELKFDNCDAKNVGKTFFVKNEASAYFAEDFEDVSKSKVRFVCDEKDGWVAISDSLKDTKYASEGKEGDVRQGVFTNLYFVYEDGEWKEASAVQKDAFFVQQSAVDSFIDIQKVYDNIKTDERVIFILRHAERTDDTSKEGPLTDNGVKQSENVGKKLVKFEEDFVLGASEFVRAQKTVSSIAKGRGQDTEVRDIFPELNDDWYSKDKDEVEKAKNECGGGWEVTSKYAYTGAYSTGANAAYYNLAERSVELIEDVLLKKYADASERFVLLSSHDKLMVPLVAYCSGLKLELKKYDGGKWINYLAGVAVIVDKTGARRYVPVKGLESGYMN